MKLEKNLNVILWVAAGLLALGALFTRVGLPEYPWISILLAVLLLGVLGGLVYFYRQALRSRTALFGLNSLITAVLVLAIVGVLNFLVARYPQKLDLTRNKVHSVSDQTRKLIRELQQPVKAEVIGKMQNREKLDPLLQNYKALNPTKFEIEWIDPDKESVRVRAMGVKTLGTVHLVVGKRESKIEDVNEEKLTNALIKLLKDKVPTLCTITGHGEKNFNSPDAEGYRIVKDAMVAQSYEVKEINLIENAKDQKVPPECDAIALMGPTKPLFGPEVKMLQDYLSSGGRAVIAVDINVSGAEYSPELNQVLADWAIKPSASMIVDPMSRQAQMDASTPLIVIYQNDSPITRDFKGIASIFPFVRPLEIATDKPAGVNVQWLAQTSPASWAVSDLKQLASGTAKFDAAKDKKGPLTVAVSVDGKKDSKATRNTRMVVFGTSNFVINRFARAGGNQDFFMNAVAWVLEDESVISIRAKEEDAAKIELSPKAATMIFIVGVLLVPLLVAIAGLVVWIRRRKM